MREVSQELDDKWPLTLILSDGTLGHGGNCGEGEHMAIWGLADTPHQPVIVIKNQVPCCQIFLFFFPEQPDMQIFM